MKTIKFYSEDTVELLKANSKLLYKQVFSSKEKTVESFLGNNGKILETSYEIEDFTLDMSQPKGKAALTDAENAKRVYSHMIGLSDSQASDERIWLAYTLEEYSTYMSYRWNIESVNDMMNRYFFNYSKNRSLFRNGISRLWWIGRVTYDEKKADPFQLTKYLCNYQDFIETICGRSTFNNPIVQRATLNAIYDVLSPRRLDNRVIIRELAKYVNLLSGTYLLDMLDYDEVYGKVHSRLIELIQVLK